jgi:Uma2 family endonuclease
MDTRTLMTIEEFEEAAARLGPCELVRGEVITLSPGGFSHSQIMLNVGALLRSWAKQQRLGRVVGGEMGVVVEQRPATVRGADVAYFSYERLPRHNKPEGFSRVPPNLVVEIVGKGQGWRVMVEKAGEYLRMGVDRVWIIDPPTQRVHIYQPEAEPVVVGCGQVLSDEAILPGFSCRVDEFFED